MPKHHNAAEINEAVDFIWQLQDEFRRHQQDVAALRERVQALETELADTQPHFTESRCEPHTTKPTPSSSN